MTEIKRRPRIDNMSKKAQKVLEHLDSLGKPDPNLMKDILKSAKKFKK